jgi:hypothetical protein
MVLWALLEVYRATQQVNPIIPSHVTAFPPAGRAGAPAAEYLERQGWIAPDFKSNYY